MNILVIGGAGYIGSITTKLLLKKGYNPVIVDNISTGHLSAIPDRCSYYRLDIRNKHLLKMVLKQEKIDMVIHFAAYSLVSESVQFPHKYFQNNVMGAISLLETMRAAKVNRIIFSSTAAVYGDPITIPIDEEHRLEPINPYGSSKVFIEKALDHYSEAYGFRSLSFRYFNACGAWFDGHCGEDHRPETHLIPLILNQNLMKGETLHVYGDDYSTPDGTPIRDYIHVVDLAEAHILGLEYLLNGGDTIHLNLGNEKGYSVLEVILAAETVTGLPVNYNVSRRRPGDPAILIASAAKAKELLGWKPQRSTMEEMIESAWLWHQQHPAGYSE